MSEHTCHALGCRAPCPPRHLMCARHWSMVPAALQREVYRTVRLRGRGGSVDSTWAPWWRAAHRAIAEVAHLEVPNAAKRDAYIARAEAFAAKLEARAAGAVVR